MANCKLVKEVYKASFVRKRRRARQRKTLVENIRNEAMNEEVEGI